MLLTTDGQRFDVDEHLYPVLASLAWHTNDKGQACRTMTLSQFVCLLSGVDLMDKLVSFRDGNHRNCRAENLLALPAIDQRKRRRKQRGSSKYIGVSKHGKRWRATITHDYTRIHIGVFDTEEEAARARDHRAKHLSKHYRLNDA